MTAVDPTALARFTTTLFRNCTSDGALCLYVFSHNQSERAIAQQWAAPSDLVAPARLAQQAATHPQPAVFCPPVALFGPLTNEAGKRTTAERNVLEAPVITLELDANPADGRLMAESVLGPATLVVASGGLTAAGEPKIHLYWRLATPARTPEERADLTRVRKLLAAWAGGDASGAPICHPMRWPGSVHRKAEARLATTLDETDRDVVLADALALLEPLVPDLPAARTAVALSGEPLPPGEAARLAATIPNEGPANWAEWSRIGMAFFASTHGSDEGEEAFMAWSARNPAHDPDEVSSRWGHWHNSPPTQLTAGTLYHAAGETRGPAPDAASVFADPADLPPEALTESPHVRLQALAREAGFLPHDGSRPILADEQIALFAGCVYIRSLDAVRVPDGDFLTQSQFDAEFGGYSYIIHAEKTPSDSAWKAFHKNPRFRPPMAHATCFRPERPAGMLIEEEGRILLNTWVPVHTPRTAGDPAPFLDFLTRILPSAHDRAILLHYMASMVQNPGVKFQWWPVVQGAEGNGKSYIGRALTRAVGVRYTHLVNPEAMISTGNQFNGWVEGNLFVIIEELGVGHKRDALEILKPLVTNDRMPIERKGKSQVAGDNRVNGVIFTNYKDGVPTKKGNRRYSIFFTAQQEPEDLERDGLTERYFVNLYDWSHGRGAYEGQVPGWHIITDYLAQYPLQAELDPAQMAQRAPATTSFDEAIVVGRGPVEQEIVAAIEEERPGFCGGWISGKALDTLLTQKRINVPHNRRGDLVKGIGYITHPGLPEGKTSSAVPPDGVRCRLYVRAGHLSLNLMTPQAVTDAYVKAQLGPASDQAVAVLNRTPG